MFFLGIIAVILIVVFNGYHCCRFGPGLVIYWFGCLDVVLNQGDKRLIIYESFPENLTFLNPSLIKAPTLS